MQMLKQLGMALGFVRQPKENELEVILRNISSSGTTGKMSYIESIPNNIEDKKQYIGKLALKKTEQNPQYNNVRITNYEGPFKKYNVEINVK